MSHSLLELFRELSVQDQAQVREYMSFLLQPLPYFKQQMRSLSLTEKHKLARLLLQENSCETVEEFSQDESSYIESRDNSFLSEVSSVDESYSAIDQPLMSTLAPVLGHCERCSCHENDDCACARGCDHYYGTVQDLNEELEEIAQDNAWHRYEEGKRLNYAPDMYEWKKTSFW